MFENDKNVDEKIGLIGDLWIKIKKQLSGKTISDIIKSKTVPDALKKDERIIIQFLLQLHKLKKGKNDKDFPIINKLLNDLTQLEEHPERTDLIDKIDDEIKGLIEIN